MVDTWIPGRGWTVVVTGWGAQPNEASKIGTADHQEAGEGRALAA